MKLKPLAVMALATALTSCGNGGSSIVDETNDPQYIGRNKITVENGRITPEVLWAFGRVSDLQVSPDQSQILYGVSYYDVSQNSSNRELFTMSPDGSNVKQITKTTGSENAARWINNGKKIAFIKSVAGEPQLWEMNPDGSDRRQISDKKGGISDYLYSPDGSKVILIANVKLGQTTQDRYPDLDKTSGMVIEDLNYKHWDEWVTSVPHPFIYDYDGTSLTNERDIIEEEPFESPVKPFGGAEQLAFSPDSRHIVYTCKKLTGKAYAISTNNDIYLYDITSGKTIANLSEGNMGYDINPTFSPDGKKLAWESMERDGYESDKNRLFVIDMETREKNYITKDFDQSVASLAWDEKGENIYFTSCQHGTTQIYVANIASHEIRQITDGQHDYEQIALCAGNIIGMRHSMSAPNDIFSVSMDGTQTQISFENKHILDQIEMGRVEPRWIGTTDGKEELVWIIYPPHFDASRKYPTLLYCEGGPQSPVSQFWSYRWNFQIMAHNDYIIVAPNRRGLYGFGQEWLEAISKDYGGQCMRDYFSAIDAMAKEPFVDTDKLGCVGASFGGYSVYWIAGHHDGRFKAFIAHDGMFNLEQQYLETEEMFFVNWDLGGAYWDKSTAETYANSPHKFVDRWDTPIMVIHGEKDYRILASQGMAAFNAARMRDIPAELLIFPDENHWVLQPQNGVLWQRRFFSWLDRWLKD